MKILKVIGNVIEILGKILMTPFALAIAIFNWTWEKFE